jgi:hypothetical protein
MAASAATDSVLRVNEGQSIITILYVPVLVSGPRRICTESRSTRLEKDAITAYDWDSEVGSLRL